MGIEKEEWRAISIAPDYEVSSIGRVRRVTCNQRGMYAGIFMKPYINDSGYEMHTLTVDGKTIKKSTHALVCTAFSGNSEGGRQAAHRDGNKRNNRAGNLYWATAKENAADKIRHGTQAKGDTHWTHLYPHMIKRGDEHHTRKNPERNLRGSQKPNATLTDDQVREIRSTSFKRGDGQKMADKFGVSKYVISLVRRGKTYTHI